MALQELTPSVLRGLNATISDAYNTRLEAEPPSQFFSRCVLETNSTRAFEEYAWVLSFAAMREWLGERQIMSQTLLDTYLIRNRTFEHTMQVKIADIEDNVYAQRAKYEAVEAADAYQRRKNDMIFDLLIASFGARANPSDSSTWFQTGSEVTGPDGVPLFSTDHPLGQMKRVRENGQETYVFNQTNTWSNLVTTPFSKDALKAARKAMRQQKDHYGRPARMNGNLLVVGPENEDAAIEAVAPTAVVRTTVDGGTTTEERTTNSLAGAYEVLVLNELDDSPFWAVFDTTRQVKPFIFQNRVKPQQQRTAAIAASAASGLVPEGIFNDDAIKYGVRARMGAGIGHPLTASGSTGTGA
jgi:phage major head subunit gpT-like protein